MARPSIRFRVDKLCSESIVFKVGICAGATPGPTSIMHASSATMHTPHRRRMRAGHKALCLRRRRTVRQLDPSMATSITSNPCRYLRVLDSRVHGSGLAHQVEPRKRLTKTRPRPLDEWIDRWTNYVDKPHTIDTNLVTGTQNQSRAYESIKIDQN